MLRKSPRIIEVTLAGALAVAAGCAHHHSGGPRDHGVGKGSGLVVLGTGEAKAAPDSARTTIGVEVRSSSAEQATAQANERMSAVIAAIKAAGVADADLRTSDFSISFERDFTPPQPVVQVQTAPQKGGARAVEASAVAAPPAASEPKGLYRVSNMVEVTIRDIALTSRVLTAATDAGANNVWEVSFDIADREPLHAAARAQAIARAQQNAKQLAQLAGVRLGRIVAVEDEPATGGGQIYASLRSEKAMVAAPIEPGQRTVTHQVRLVYELE